MIPFFSTPSIPLTSSWYLSALLFRLQLHFVIMTIFSHLSSTTALQVDTVLSPYNTSVQRLQISWPWGFVQEKSFDHVDLSIEESGENDETGEDDKAGDAEVTGF